MEWSECFLVTTQVRGLFIAQILEGGIYRQRRGDLVATGPAGDLGGREAPNAGRPRGPASPP
jgi:hypothetical protein